jgi:hypothetical protein
VKVFSCVKYEVTSAMMASKKNYWIEICTIKKIRSHNNVYKNVEEKFWSHFSPVRVLKNLKSVRRVFRSLLYLVTERYPANIWLKVDTQYPSTQVSTLVSSQRAKSRLSFINSFLYVTVFIKDIDQIRQQVWGLSWIDTKVLI